MAKNVTELPIGSPDKTSILYFSDGVADYQTTVEKILAAGKDIGIIYDPAGAMTITTTPQPIVAATKGDAFASSFTIDNTNGQFVFNASAVGGTYRVEFTFVTPKGSLSNQELEAQLNLDGSTSLLDVAFMGNASTTGAVNGSGVFAPASGSVMTMDVLATANSTSQTPVTVSVIVSRL